MRLLLTADLHFRLHWFRWLIEQAPDFDLICIAGDLLDMFRSETRMEQAREVRTLVRELADCSSRDLLGQSRQCWPTRPA
jgi:Icc-related predicted phosphoesterase